MNEPAARWEGAVLNAKKEKKTMELKLLLQEGKVHLIREKPLVVRSLRNNLYPVTGIEGEPRDLVKVSYTNPSGRWYLRLYPGCRRLQEIEDQITGTQASDLRPYEDRVEALEVALLEHFLDHYRVFTSTIVVKVDTPYMKQIDGKWMVGKVAWQRREGEALSQRIYEPASNALELSCFAETALKHCGYYESQCYGETDLQYRLTDCPPTLVKQAQFVPQSGRIGISEAMEQYTCGTRVRLMECRCEYFLEGKRQGLTWVSVAARCKAHTYMERVYGWLCSEQVEIVQ